MVNISPEERERVAREGVTRESIAGTPGFRQEEERSVKVVAGGSITEALAGAGAVVLAIIGLAGTLPGYMAAVATLALGVALLAHGGAVASRFSKLVHETSGFRAEPKVELGAGVGAETFGGAAGIVLGILSLLSILPAVLLPIALIVFGATVLLGSGVTADLSSMATDIHSRRAQMAREATIGASGLQVLAGVTGIVLGIIALAGTVPLSLTLVGLLVIGAAILLSGSAITGRLMSVSHH